LEAAPGFQPQQVAVIPFLVFKHEALRDVVNIKMITASSSRMVSQRCMQGHVLLVFWQPGCGAIDAASVGGM
jgi:hypothetical protein